MELHLDVEYNDEDYDEKIEESERARAWVFTDFKIPSKLEENYYGLKDKCLYMIYGLEKCPSTERLHYQGYVYFKDAKSFKSMKKIFQNARLAKAKGNPKQNYVYCSKGKNYWECGELPKQGKRSDLDDIADMVKAKKPLKEIAIEYSSQYIQYHKGIIALKNALHDDRTEKPNVMWFWGFTGAGKTRKAVEISGGDYYIKDSSPWWDGYDQQKVIIIDDFNSKNWDYRDLLRLLDRYKYQGQYKGGFVKINSPTIIITCDSHPEIFYKDGELAQLMRRIDNVRHIDEHTSDDENLL